MTDVSSDPQLPTLHLVFSAAGFAACSLRCDPADTLVLLADGVYAGPGIGHKAVKSAAIKVLDADLALRGVSGHLLTPAIKVIDDAALVDLVCEHGPTVSWR